MRSVAAAVVMVVLCAGPAWAQEGTYAGVSYGSVSYKEDGVASAEPAALAFRLGLQVHRHLALEARAGFGAGDDTATRLGVPITVEVDHYFGVYGKGILPLSESFSVYGLLGVLGGRVTAKGLGYSASASDTDLSYGLGIDLAFGKHAGISFEWAALFKDRGYEVEAASVGFVYRY